MACRRMEPTMENKSSCKETTTKSNGTTDEEKSSKEAIEGEQGGNIKKETQSSRPSSPDVKFFTKQVSSIANSDNTSMEADPKDSTSSKKDDQEDQLESTKAEMCQVREENERLKQLLAKTVKDYQSLQMQFFDNFQQEEAKNSPDKASTTTHQENEKHEAELVSLSLGISSSDEPKKSNTGNTNNAKEDDEKLHEGLRLGLECKFEHELTTDASTKEPINSESTFEERKEDEPSELWPPSKVLKTIRNEDHEEALQERHLKKPRVCVRARCDSPTMNDGCQWRKYGQKVAKGNPCPRAYYRCTVSPNCPVKKQVQRCLQDMSILITTYEGTHNHPLPMSARAMASTTSAAASMLESRYTSSSLSTSEPSLTAPLSISTTANSAHNNINALNFTFPPTTSRPSPHFNNNNNYFPNSSISTSNSHPTITLDLTLPSNRFSTSQRYPSTCLNFSSSSLDQSGYLTHGIPSYTRNQFGLTSSARYPTHSNIQEHIYQPFMHMQNNTSTQQSLTDSITAAAKVITANPSFQSALAAALTSVVSHAGGQSTHGVESSCLSLKLGESLPINSVGGYSFKKNSSVGWASSYGNKSTSLSSQQQGSLTLFPSSVQLDKSNSTSGSSGDDRDRK